MTLEQYFELSLRAYLTKTPDEYAEAKAQLLPAPDTSEVSATLTALSGAVGGLAEIWGKSIHRFATDTARGDVSTFVSIDDVGDAKAESLRWSVFAAVNACHGQAKANGWWNELGTGRDLTSMGYPKILPAVNVGEKLMLVVTEVAEAMEGARKHVMDDHLPSRSMLEVELADAFIRICDTAGGLGLDLAGAVVEKLAYNATRADHKPENRRAVGGKKS